MKKKTSISEVLNEQDEKRRGETYNKYVKQMTPTTSLLRNLFHAYWVGGLICVIGQFLMNWFLGMGLEQDTSAAYNTLVLIFISVLLTGFQIYPRLTKFAGAGTVVPITGFANSVAASAIEFKKEGQVFGIGCKIFTIAGPVILYGIVSSWIFGLIYWLVQILEGR